MSGVAALLLSNLNSTTNLQNNLAPENVEQLLQRTATDKEKINAAAPYNNETGWGLLNAGAALYKSRPGAYRLVHDRLTASSAVFTNNVRVQLVSDYASGNTSLAAGIYMADRYRVTGTFSPRASLVTANKQILGASVPPTYGRRPTRRKPKPAYGYVLKSEYCDGRRLYVFHQV